jgi:energy-coupling factor transporter transmembrane protein EcfT
MRYGFFFLLTLAIELPIIFLVLKKISKQIFLVAFLLNLFTWPLLHFVYFNTHINVLLLEVLVFLIEAAGYQLLLKKGWQISILTSLLANLCSYGIGLIII